MLYFNFIFYCLKIKITKWNIQIKFFFRNHNIITYFTILKNYLIINIQVLCGMLSLMYIWLLYVYDIIWIICNILLRNFTCLSLLLESDHIPGIAQCAISIQVSDFQLCFNLSELWFLKIVQEFIVLLQSLCKTGVSINRIYKIKQSMI